MRPIEVELWARRVIERAVSKQPVEDARVELKREWVDDYEMARRLAGHANAARAERVLWLIGVDEKAGTVPGADRRDASSWFPKVESWFDGSAPSMIDVAVVHEGVTVMALLFETDFPPYVVRNPAFGKSGDKVQHEVPWRAGTAIRTARREDLVRILGPLSLLPSCELRRCSVDAIEDDPLKGRCTVLLYFVATTRDRVFVPLHRCKGRIRNVEREWVDLTDVSLIEDTGVPRFRDRRPSLSIAISETELVLDGAGGAILRGTYPLVLTGRESLTPAIADAEGLEVELVLGVAGVDTPLAVHGMLEPAERRSHEGIAWAPRGA